LFPWSLLLLAGLAGFVLGACVSPGALPLAASSTPTTTTTMACTNVQQLAAWDLPRLAAQTLMVPVDEGDVASIAPQVAAGAGGVILFGSMAPPDLGSRLTQLDATAPGGVAPLVATDEEGGAVQRMANLVGGIPSAREMALTMTPAEIESLAFGLGQRLRAAGVTVDLAPVLDLDAGDGPSSTDPDGTRSFGVSPTLVTADGLAFLGGLEQAGVVPVVKHFPGLGGATGNTDNGPASTAPWSIVEHEGLVPFEAAVADVVPAVMVTDATVPGLTNVPASISGAVIEGVLRGRLGFDGLVLTDSLSAGAFGALGYSVPQATVDALIAGADMVLYSADSSQVGALTDQTVAAIVSAVSSGQLSLSRLIDADAHILGAKHVNLCP